jgi:hypothetical protein
MSAIDKIAEVFQMPDEDTGKDLDWESNKDNENPEQLPWPEENEAKE